MPNPDPLGRLAAYAAAVRRDRRANPAAAGEGTALELLLAPRFQALLEDLLAARRPAAPAVLPEYRRPGLGRPDLAFKRPGAPARAFIELKQPASALERRRLRGHDAGQFRRFSELPLWGFCNFHTIHLYRRGECLGEATIVPEAALDPTTSDAAAERLIRATDPARFLEILDTLAIAQPVRPGSAKEIATVLAEAARLVRAIVEDCCRADPPPRALEPVRADFQELLFAHHAAGGYERGDRDEIALFAAAFAQTLAFGLLLAREAGAKREPPVAQLDRHAYELLPRGAYPLLRSTLQVLTTDPVLDVLGAGFDVLLDTVNAIDTDHLQPRAGRDPVLYLYEDFLETFDPTDRRRHGVYFTPVEVVRFMVAATDRALRAAGLAAAGLNDGRVKLLDPACGTGTFLVAAAAHAAAVAAARHGEGAVAAERASLARRLHGFELLVGPYTVAHYRLLRELGGGAAGAGRLPIYLADTLRPPGMAGGVTARLGELLGESLVEERRAADRVKNEEEILAIIGNPPYRRLDEGEEDRIKSGWDGGFWEDLKDPVRAAGWGGELNTFPELSVAFWRWSLWKLFECDGAARRGVLCLITNRSFLSGHPYAGLRQALRRRFDAIEILDLRGGSRGARPAGVTVDENVFDIRVGVCVLTAVAAGGARPAGAEARVRYADAWRHGAFTRSDKLALLERASADPATLDFVAIERGGLEDFLPVPFAGLDWPGLDEAFAFRSSGVETKRDDFAYAHSADVLLARWRAFEATDADEASRVFHPTPLRTVAAAKATALSADEIRLAAYRPLDRRHLIAAVRVIDRHRPALQEVWGATNLCLFSLPSGTGAGPAVWVHGLLPDRHAFRGSYGGYAFPLWDRRRGPAAHNLNADLLAGLAAAYGRPVSPAEAFHAIAALLSARSYTARFAADLEAVFPHIPFPAEADAFAAAARIGAEIAALESFARDPAERFRTARLEGRGTGDRLEVPEDPPFVAIGDGTGAVALLADQSLRLARVPEPVWGFAVSGYRVLPRWLAARRGEPMDKAFNEALLDLAARIAELLHWFDTADAVLARAVARPLTREALGLAPALANRAPAGADSAP